MIRQVALQRLNAAYQGRAREESYLELAQEHFLDWMRASGLLGEVIFNGGTSLRKFAFGLQGRFSLDLDFTTRDRAAGELVIDALEAGFTHEGVRFARDVYDLHGLLPYVRDDVAIIRELLLYKVYFDVVDDGRGTAPFTLGAEFTGKRAADIQGTEELGALTGRTIDLGQMLNHLAGTFGAMTQPLSPREEVIARCGRGDRYRVEQWLHERREAFRQHA